MEVGQDAHALGVLVRVEQPTRGFGDQDAAEAEDGADDDLDEERQTPGPVGPVRDRRLGKRNAAERRLESACSAHSMKLEPQSIHTDDA